MLYGSTNRRLVQNGELILSQIRLYIDYPRSIMFVVRTLVLDRIRTKVLTTNQFDRGRSTGHDISSH